MLIHYMVIGFFFIVPMALAIYVAMDCLKHYNKKYNK